MSSGHAVARMLFAQFDHDGDGAVDFAELVSLCEVLGIQLTGQQMLALLSKLDKNGDGVVSRSEQSAKKNDSSDVKVAIVGTTAPSLWGEVPTDTWKD